jgi:hypothetical protein
MSLFSKEQMQTPFYLHEDAFSSQQTFMYLCASIVLNLVGIMYVCDHLSTHVYMCATKLADMHVCVRDLAHAGSIT